MEILLVTGSKEIAHRDIIVNELTIANPDLVLVGDAPCTVDFFTKEWCINNKVKCEIFKIGFGKFGNGASFARNRRMVDRLFQLKKDNYEVSALVFHNNKSNVTKHCINLLNKINIPIKMAKAV